MRSTGLGIFAALGAALLPFVTTNSVFYGSINAKFFFVIVLTDILLLSGAYLIFKGKGQLRLARPLLYALGALLFVQYIAMFFGVHPGRSWWSDLFWMSGVLFLTHIAALALILATFLTKADWARIRRSVALSTGLFGLLTIIGVEGMGYSEKLLWLPMGDSGLSFGNGTYAGVYLLLAFVLGLIELSHTAPGKWRRLLIASLAGMGLSPVLVNIGILFGKVPLGEVLANPILILGSSRASSATFILLLVYLGGRFALSRFAPDRAKQSVLRAWGAAVLLGIALGVGLLFTPGSFVQKAYIESSTAARLIVWESSFEAFAERPFLGWGPENFNHALERHFDNRLFLNENIGEIWFDKAHNFFVDTAVTTGAIGLLAGILVMAAFIFTVYRARESELIGETESILLMALVPAHLLQLQTGFDTVATYALLGFIAGYALWLEGQLGEESSKKVAPTSFTRTVVAAGMVLAALASFTVVFLSELERQTALVRTFKSSGNAEAQKAALAQSLSRTSSFESLRLSSASFLKGALMTIAQSNDPGSVRKVLAFIAVYEAQYQRYLALAPDHYRARMNYAYLLLLKSTLGENRLEEAKAVIRDSYRLSPENPLTYILESLAELYGGNLREADRLMKKALALNPEISFTKEAAAHLEKQKRQFPNITVLKIGNL